MMISVEEARTRILGHFDILDPEFKPILDAQGQVLAQDVVGPFDLPPLDNSAMDGYAIVSGDVAEASPYNPVTLRVVGFLAAGQVPTKNVVPGTAIRIMTGAPIPDGADAVVPFENTDEMDRKSSGRELSEIDVRIEVPVSANIRSAGDDVKKDDRVIPKGNTLGAAEIGVLASLGYEHVNVFRRPIVAIIATGNELLGIGGEPEVGKIYDSNSYSLAASVRNAGGVPRLVGIALDDVDDLSNKLEAGLSSDILLTSAGVSKGDYDIVKDVIADRGQIDLWSVRMRPAKPLAFGMLDLNKNNPVPHLGLPGNPVSALVGFEQFGRPAIRKMMGHKKLDRPTIWATLEEPIYNYDNRKVFARVVVKKRKGRYFVNLTGNQNSNILTSMTRANGLAICPEDLPVKEPGQLVEVQMLDWPEEVF